MIRLILVRHGNTFEANQTPVQVGARTDLPLTQVGRSQAEELAKILKPTAIYCGDLKRQKESAHIIGGGKYLLEPALTEIDYGLWEGLTSDEIVHRFPQEYADWTQMSIWPRAIFGGSIENHLENIDKWLASLRKMYKSGDTVVGISSNGLIRLFCSFEKERWSQLQRTRQMETLKVKTGHFCEFILSTDSLTVKNWSIQKQVETAFLS